MKAKSKKGEKTRRRILLAAGALLPKKGFHGMSVDDILANSKTGKSQFYHYFASKEALFLELILLFDAGEVEFFGECTEEPVSIAPSLFRQIPHLTGLNILYDWLDAFPQAFESGRYKSGCPLGNLASEMSTQNEELREALHQVFESWEDLIEKELINLIDLGQLPKSLHARHTAYLTLSTLQGAMVFAKAKKSSLPLIQAVKSIKELLKQNHTPQGKRRKKYMPSLITFAP